MKHQGDLKLQFLGGAGQVTGSKTLLVYRGYRVLIDCGLFQGPKDVRVKNYEELNISKDLDLVILTHAHIDHSGYLPKIVKEGYKNPVYCSGATKELCRIMLLDAAYLQEEDHSHGGEEPLYNTHDAEKAILLLKAMEMNQWKELIPGLSFRFLRAGHILGSCYVQILFEIENGTRILTFSGDVGNGRSSVIKPPSKLTETDFLVMESTYGDRVQPRTDPMIELEKIINKVISRAGTLVIPSFAIGRSQELLYLIHQLEIQKRIPKVPVYLDSPMALDATEIYRHHPEELLLYDEKKELKLSVTPESFIPVQSVEDSKSLCKSTTPKIVLSAAGMLTGGRILHHVAAKLPDARNGVLFVGYQVEGTKGQLLKNGMTTIRIHKVQIPVKAEVFSMETLSAHADSDDLIQFLKNIQRPPQMIFLNHGEPAPLKALHYRIIHELQWTCEIAQGGQTYILGKQFREEHNIK